MARAFSDPHSNDSDTEHGSDVRSDVSSSDEAAKTPDDADQMAAWEEALKNDDWGHQPC